MIKGQQNKLYLITGSEVLPQTESTEICLVHKNQCTKKDQSTGKKRICNCAHKILLKEEEAMKNMGLKSEKYDQNYLENTEIEAGVAQQDTAHVNDKDCCSEKAILETQSCGTVSLTAQSKEESASKKSSHGSGKETKAALKSPEITFQCSNVSHKCTRVPCTPSCDSHCLNDNTEH